MKTIQWAQYSWDLTKSPPSRPALPSAFSIRRATREDEETVRSLVLSVFTLQSDWNPSFHLVRPLVEASLEKLFEEKTNPLCLVIHHGPRIIGVSGLLGEKDACNHLLTGPCLVLEYHNRGLGTLLLAHSLSLLHETGLSTVRGVTKQGTATAQFIYPKFGSIRMEPSDSLALELGKQARSGS